MQSNHLFFDGKDIYENNTDLNFNKWVKSLLGLKTVPELYNVFWYDQSDIVVVYATSLRDLHEYILKEAPTYARSLTFSGEVCVDDNSFFFANFDLDLFSIPESYNDFESDLIDNHSLRAPLSENMEMNDDPDFDWEEDTLN